MIQSSTIIPDFNSMKDLGMYLYRLKRITLQLLMIERGPSYRCARRGVLYEWTGHKELGSNTVPTPGRIAWTLGYSIESHQQC